MIVRTINAKRRENFRKEDFICVHRTLEVVSSCRKIVSRAVSHGAEYRYIRI